MIDKSFLPRAFDDKVYEAIRGVPDGYVTTYGDIAAAIGHPGAARAVGNSVHRNPDGKYTPCYKVVKASGELAPAYAFGGIYVQKHLLEESGVEVINNRVDMRIYRYPAFARHS